MDLTRAKAYLQAALEPCIANHPRRIAILNKCARILGHSARKDSDLSDLELFDPMLL